MKTGEIEADKDRMMRQYRAQLDAERERKLSHGRNHSSCNSKHRKGLSCLKCWLLEPLKAYFDLLLASLTTIISYLSWLTWVFSSTYILHDISSWVVLAVQYYLHSHRTP